MFIELVHLFIFPQSTSHTNIIHPVTSQLNAVT
nr:MAG TPA: hypothetical protein [Caudoviricetes sp.]